MNLAMNPVASSGPPPKTIPSDQRGGKGRAFDAELDAGTPGREQPRVADRDEPSALLDGDLPRLDRADAGRIAKQADDDVATATGPADDGKSPPPDRTFRRIAAYIVGLAGPDRAEKDPGRDATTDAEEENEAPVSTAEIVPLAVVTTRSPDAPAALPAETPRTAPDTGRSPAQQPSGSSSAGALAAAITDAGHPQADADTDGDGANPQPRGEDLRREAKSLPAAADIPADGNVRVVSTQAASAPAQPQILPPSVQIADNIARDVAQAPVFSGVSAAAAPVSAAPNGGFRELRIQLNPAELGMVNARLTIVAEQLTVEITIEKPEAYRALAADRDAIVTALRGLGLQVENVVVQQQPAGRDGASPNGQSASNQGTGSADAGTRDGAGRQGAGQGGTHGQHPSEPAQRAGGDPSGGLYI